MAAPGAGDFLKDIRQLPQVRPKIAVMVSLCLAASGRFQPPGKICRLHRPPAAVCSCRLRPSRTAPAAPSPGPLLWHPPVPVPDSAPGILVAKGKPRHTHGIRIMAYDYIHEVLQDGSIEGPARSILVRFHHKAFRPAGSDFAFPPTTSWWKCCPIPNMAPWKSPVATTACMARALRSSAAPGAAARVGKSSSRNAAPGCLPMRPRPGATPTRPWRNACKRQPLPQHP